MTTHRNATAALLLSAALATIPSPTDAAFVRFETTLGNVVVRLRPDAAPINVANFLNYVETDRYEGTFIHRVPEPGNFVVQGGGFRLNDSIFDAGPIPTDALVGDEPNLSNVRGTLAMAKGPLGATSQWYFNLQDNSFLDAQGFTVIGQVTGTGMAVVDAIAALELVDARVAENEPGEDYDEIPVLDVQEVFAESDIRNDNAVLIQRISIVIPEPGTGTLAAVFGLLATVRVRRLVA